MVCLITPKGGVALQVPVVGGGTSGLAIDVIGLQASLCGVNQSIKFSFESIGLL